MKPMSPVLVAALAALLLMPAVRADAGTAAAIERPLPADLQPMAARSLMLDVVATGKRLIAVGERGQILASIDGRKWLQVPVPVRSALTAVSFADERHGWAVGHDAAIVATADGGRTWTLQHFQPALEKPLLDVLFLDLRRGLAIGAFGLILGTQDGGATWSELRVPAIDADELNLHSLTRLANDDLLITGEQGRLLLSTDQGATWTALRSPVGGTVFAAAAHGRSGVLICGLGGQAWLSPWPRIGGWNPVETGTRAGLHGCTTIDRQRAVLVGLDGTLLVADLDKRTAERYRSPSPKTWSAVARWQDRLVLAGAAGLMSIGPVDALP